MNFLQDLRIAVRSLRRAAGFTALTTMVLAFGLAVVVIMFGILHEVAYVPPPVERPDSLVNIRTIDVAQHDFDRDVSPHDYVDWSRSQTVFERMAGFYDGTLIVSGQGPAERYTGGFVTGEFFNLFGIPPMLGRSIEPRDALQGAAPVVVLGEDLWRTRYRADPSLIGRSLRVNGQTATVVGVAPHRFMYPAGAELWIPLQEPYDKGARGEGLTMNVSARLKEGVSMDEAQAQLSVIAARLAKQYPETNASVQPDIMPIALWSGRDDLKLFQMFLLSVFLVLVIACVNVAGLMLVRATSRTQEAGIRRAIGAGRGRLIGQMLSEAVVIGALASLLGLTIAAGALELLNKLLPRFVEQMPGWWDFSVDGTVAAFAIVVGVVSTTFAGLYPALRVSGLDVNSIIREGTRDTGMSTGRIIRWLVVAEIALSCAILTSAGIVIRTATFGANGDVGADVRPFMAGRVGLPESVYGKEAQVRFVEKLLPALERVPGATAATVITSPPGWGAGEYPFAQRGGSYNSQSDYPLAHEVSTSPGFFSAFRVPLRQGRDFTMLDRLGTQPVAIVSESFVQKFWPDGNALGKQIRMHPTDPDAPWLTVIGISANVLHDDEPFKLGAPQPTVYVSLLQRPERFFTALLRTTGEPHALAPAIRNIVAQIDPEMPVYFLRTIPESRALNAGGLRLLGGLFVWFGIVTIVLTAAGIYGVLAHSVAQNAREIAIRRALGAPDRGIIKSIARRSGWQLGLGLTLGVVLAPLMGLLFGAATSGTPIHDRTTYIVVFTVLTIAIVLATALPLRRALRLQPIVALRHT